VSNRQAASMTNGLTRRAALTSATVGGIAAIALSTARAAAQDATSEPTDEGLSRLELARLAAELRTALVPVIVTTRTQSDDELAQSATDYLEQLKEQQNVTEEEGSALQQIVDAASSEGDDQTKIEKIEEIADNLSEEGDGASPAAVAIAGIAAAIARRDERSSSSDAATPAAEETDFWDRVKRGIVGALAGAAIGGVIAGEDGAVIGAIAGGLAGAI
jgi:hypothetical protein